MERTCELIRQAKEGNKKAQEILVEENTGLIWSVVKRFQGRGYDKEDLFQIGSIGLLKCIDNFDLERKVKFSTYAVPLIMGEIKRFLRDDIVPWSVDGTVLTYLAASLRILHNIF